MKIENIKEHIQEISENIGVSVRTPVPSISTEFSSIEKLIDENNYNGLKKYEYRINIMFLATMFYFVDRGYSYNQIAISDIDYYIGLSAFLTWIIYLILLATRKGSRLRIFNVILCMQLGYFFFRIFLETDKFVFPLIGSIIAFIIAIRSFLIKP